MKGKTILITGGTGSLGQEITKQLLKLEPRTIRLLSNSEWELYDAKRHMPEETLRFLLGDVRDADRMHRAMVGVNIVIHCAALKHVPICEYNPIEAVRTNVLGSINVIDAALDNGVDKVIAISSDKAVHPINIYGATKLTMEKLFIQANVYLGTKFSCVRFGNIQESKGSVLSLWYQQIIRGEPITVTERDMTRYWITLEKAAEFTVKCLEMMEGAEIFIPKMPEVELMKVAQEMKSEHGFRFIGKRPGEKLHEMLFAEGENPKDCGDYFVIENDNS